MENNREESVRRFHEACDLDVCAEPTVRLLQLRRTLIEEEVNELFTEIDTAIAQIEKGEKVPHELYVNMLKELVDVQVVLSGTAVALKPLQKFEEAFERVMASNMSKLDDAGKPVLREDGKVLKGPNYFKPDLSDLV